MSKIIEYFSKNSPELLGPIENIRPMPNNWREIPINKDSPVHEEPLVALGKFQDHPRLLTNSMYFAERADSPYEHGELKGALINCFVRKGVAEALERVSDMLPPGYALMVWDSYRPVEVQKALYDDYVDQLIEKKGLSRDAAELEALTFVSKPSTNPDNPSPHLTGGSVDLTIVEIKDDMIGRWEYLTDKVVKLRAEEKALLEKYEIDPFSDPNKWPQDALHKSLEVFDVESERQRIVRMHSRPIDVGSDFDEATDRSAVLYYENDPLSAVAADNALAGKELSKTEVHILNRRIFQNLMHAVGFTSFASEVWHFDHGNQFNAAMSGKPEAVYGPAYLSEENKKWEEVRQRHYHKVNQAARRSHASDSKLWSYKLPILSGLLSIATNPIKSAAARAAALGSLIVSFHPKGRRLEVASGPQQDTFEKDT